MDNLLKQLAERLRVFDAEIVSADEIKGWPKGRLGKLVAEGILIEVEHAEGVICSQCEENCYITPDIRTNPETSGSVGVFVCTRNPDIGRIEVDLDRLRQWRINTTKLTQLGYLEQVIGWQVSWNDDDTNYIPLKDAVNLANDDSITVKKMSGLLKKDPKFPVHHMHKGRRCKLHFAEFRAWLEHAQHGKITDKVIEQYLKGVERRKETAKQKKTKQTRSSKGKQGA